VVTPKVADLALDAALLMALAGVQKLDSNFQCERNATKRAVSSRRWPCRIFFTAEPRLSYLSRR
jgi:hypothetical protein